MNDLLPEMLWATLLLTQLPRDQALSIVREVAAYADEHVERFRESREHIDVTLSGIARLGTADTELADEDFASLRDRSQNINDQYREEVDGGRLNIPLDLDSLAQFIREKVDLQYWAEIGQAAGMEWDEDEVVKLRSNLEVSPLLSTLRAAGISSIAEVQLVLDEITFKRSQAIDWLSELVRVDKTETGDTFTAVGADVLIMLVSFFRAEQLPEDFDWDDIWASTTEAILKNMVENIADNKRWARKPRQGRLPSYRPKPS